MTRVAYCIRKSLAALSPGTPACRIRGKSGRRCPKAQWPACAVGGILKGLATLSPVAGLAVAGIAVAAGIAAAVVVEQVRRADNQTSPPCLCGNSCQKCGEEMRK